MLFCAAELGFEEFGGGLARGGGGLAEVAVDQAGAVAGVEETALRGLGAHAHDGNGAGGAGQEIQADLHVLLGIEAEGELGDIGADFALCLLIAGAIRRNIAAFRKEMPYFFFGR